MSAFRGVTLSKEGKGLSNKRLRCAKEGKDIKQWLQELWSYRELLYFLVWRDVKVRYKQTVLGGAWAIIQPFFTMVVFTLFFGKLAKMPSDGIPYPIFSYSALLPWTYFSNALTKSVNSLVGSSNLITKVYFPRVIIPLSSVLSSLVDFFIASVVLVGMMLYYRIQISWGLLLFPALIIPLVLVALGVGMVLSALNVRYRDIGHVIPFVIQLWFFATPVIYPNSIVPERFRTLIELNPMVGVIEAFRATLIPAREMDWHGLWISTGVLLFILVAGALWFRRAERTFADVV